MHALLLLAIVLFVLVFILILAVLVLVLILSLIFVLVLVIHIYDPPVFPAVVPLEIDCPKYQDLSLALKTRLVIRPAMIAAVMPPAVALRPPVSTPRKPSLLTASRTPLARL